MEIHRCRLRGVDAALGPNAGRGGGAARDAAASAQAELDQLTAKARDLAEAQRKKEKDRDDAAADGAELGKDVMVSFSAAALAAGGATSSPMQVVADAVTDAAAEQAQLLIDQTTVIEQHKTVSDQILQSIKDGGLLM